MNFSLTCPKCGNVSRRTSDDIRSMLQVRGTLRRRSELGDELLRELLVNGAYQLPCESCRHIGLTVADWVDDIVDWGDDIYCQGCDQVIPPERLEIFPDTKLCPPCQRKVDQGELDLSGEVEYCAHCGGIVKLVRRTGGGLAGYRMVCTSCSKTN